MDGDLVDVAGEEEGWGGFVLASADAEWAESVRIESGEGAGADEGAVDVEAFDGAVVGGGEVGPLVENDGWAGDRVPCAGGSGA